MSEIGFSYRGETIPETIGVHFELRFDGNTLIGRGTTHPFVVKLTPTGNVSELVLSGVAWPLAETAALLVPPLLPMIVGAVNFPLFTAEPDEREVEGETLRIAARDLTLETHDDMLLVRGDIEVT